MPDDPKQIEAHNAIINAISAAMQRARVDGLLWLESPLSSARAHINTQMLALRSLKAENEKLREAARELDKVDAATLRRIALIQEYAPGGGKYDTLSVSDQDDLNDIADAIDFARARLKGRPVS